MGDSRKRGGGHSSLPRSKTSMGKPADQRPQSSSAIEGLLEDGFKHIGRASFLIVTMLVKRVFWRSYLEEALWNLEQAQKKLGELHDRTSGRSK